MSTVSAPCLCVCVSQGFTCTINDPVDVAMLLATDLASQQRSSRVPLGTFSLDVLTSAVTLISGTIVELVRIAPSGTQVRDLPPSAPFHGTFHALPSGTQLPPLRHPLSPPRTATSAVCHLDAPSIPSKCPLLTTGRASNITQFRTSNVPITAGHGYVDARTSGSGRRLGTATPP